MNRRYFIALVFYMFGGFIGATIAVAILTMIGRAQSFNMYLFWALAPLLWHIPSMLLADYRRLIELFTEFKLKGADLEKAKSIVIERDIIPVFIVELACTNYQKTNEN